MKTLLLMRHAKSSWDDSDVTDHDRPLNPRGRRDAPRMGRLLRDEDLVPDQIISSSAVRARTTAEIIAREWDRVPGLTISPDLYHAHTSDWLQTVQRLREEWKRVLCVAHNPGLEEFLAVLVGQHIRMPTAAIARVDVEAENWSQIDTDTAGDLIDVWRPKELA